MNVPRMKISIYQWLSAGVYLLFAFLCTPAGTLRAETIDIDLCVYGGTSGGVAAAVQAARMGKTVAIVEAGRHLGGLTAGGLSAVDIGDPRSVGGIAREYFTKLAATVGVELAWDKAFESSGGGPATGGAYAIEPHRAEQVFNDLTREAGVAVHFDARLKSVKKDGIRIQELTTEDGNIFKAKMFIDATYEGDLMAKAGVSYTLLREGNAKYGEVFNGIHYSDKYAPRTNHLKPGSNGRVPGGQGVWDRDFPLDPYVIKGDPSSGLLPLINAGEPGYQGDPASGVQAYCFRLCLTTNLANRIPIAPPFDYDPNRYEIVVRFIDACQAIGDDMDLRWFSKYDALPNDKWDFNTATFGGNLPGASHAWPEASYAERELIFKEHENYHRGLLHFLATDPRVPLKVRDDMQRFGLPRDEFTDNGGWPHQIYVREARRMVSSLVMTEHHTFGRTIAPKSVSLGSYGTDTHEIRRIVKEGVLIREGKTATGRGGAPPYPIGYEAIVPKPSECDNLFITFALSASHTAFSSIRMEPVFMVTSQSAATAACLAIDDEIGVHQLDYDKLRARLIHDGQVLESPMASAQSVTALEPNGIRLDDDAEHIDSDALAAAVAVSPLTKEVPGKLTSAPSNEPVRLAKGVKPETVDGKSYDLVVIGGTASGVACAVRAARDGLQVLLVQHNQHIGGMLSNGLMQWDALYGGPRSPILSELLHNIEKDGIARFGKDSKNHQIGRYTHQHYPIGWVEPHVMERECNRLVAGELNATLLLDHYPAAVERHGILVKNITLCGYGSAKTIVVEAAIFVDATYEGDLLALAKVPYRVGREARAEFNEPHAGKVFVNIDRGQPQSLIAEGLNIRAYDMHQGSIDPTSPFTADNASQAYNYRFCVSKNPTNRFMLTEPPPGYNRDEYLHYERKSIATNAGPNLKSHMNSPILPGENHAYPEAAWPERERIIERHKNFALGLIWFLQNDESVPESKRTEYRQWGLAKDEFADNGHVPYEMYVREARRLVGRYVVTEHDGMRAKDFARTPIHSDSIAVTDWYMDSHACTLDSRPGFHYDGKLILTDESRPMQIPFRALLPQGVDNLLVPVCLSTTHIAWGAVRLEPVWMQTGEAAGVAAVLARRQNISPALLDREQLVRELCQRRFLVTFFNDLKVDADDPRIPAAQYWGTKGFFADYNARLDEPISESVLHLWREGAEQLQRGRLDANELARRIHQAQSDRPLSDGPKRGDILSGLKRN